MLISVAKVARSRIILLLVAQKEGNPILLIATNEQKQLTQNDEMQ